MKVLFSPVPDAKNQGPSVAQGGNFNTNKLHSGQLMDETHYPRGDVGEK